MTQKIILCKGLPASGKSTFAKMYCQEHPDYVRINKDDLRDLLGSPVFDRDFEDAVLDIQRRMGLAILHTKKSLIVDDTNFAPKHQQYWSNIAKSMGIIFEVVNFDTPVEECIRRDAERDKPVGKAVIMGMYEKYVLPTKS